MSGITELFDARNGSYRRLYGKAGSEDRTNLELGRIVHKDGRVEIRLRISDSKGKSIQLSDNQIDDLMDFIAANYQPIKDNHYRYIAIDDNTPLASQLSPLFKDKNTREYLIEEVISQSIAISSLVRKRRDEIERFKEMLKTDVPEQGWQNWFKKNTWVFGSPYVRILDSRDIDEDHQSDYLLKTVDGFTDIAEIKLPKEKIWKDTKDHGNLVPRVEVTEAIVQCINYIYCLEQRTNDVRKQHNLQSRIVKPTCMLIIGRSFNWDDDQREAFRLLNDSFHGVSIITYDMILQYAEWMLNWDESSINQDELQHSS